MYLTDILADIVGAEGFQKTLDKNRASLAPVNEIMDSIDMMKKSSDSQGCSDIAEQFYTHLRQTCLPLETAAALSSYAVSRLSDERKECTVDIDKLPIITEQIARDSFMGQFSENGMNAPVFMELFFRYASQDPAYLRIPVKELPSTVKNFGNSLYRAKRFLAKTQPRTYQQLIAICKTTFNNTWASMVADLKKRLSAETQNPAENQDVNEIRTNIVQSRMLQRYEKQTGIKLSYLLPYVERVYKALAL